MVFTGTLPCAAGFRLTPTLETATLTPQNTAVHAVQPAPVPYPAQNATSSGPNAPASAIQPPISDAAS